MRINNFINDFPSKQAQVKAKDASSEAKARLSEADIRAKIAAHKAKNDSTKVELSKTKKPSEKEAAETDLVFQPNVGLVNDPTDPATQEKLKDILRNGGFSFSDKERSVLGQILEP